MAVEPPLVEPRSSRHLASIVRSTSPSTRTVTPTIRIPLFSPSRLQRSPQPLPRPLVRAVNAALQREQAAKKQNASVVPPSRQFVAVASSVLPATDAIVAGSPPRSPAGYMAGQRLAAHEAVQHVPSIAEYTAFLAAHEEEERKQRPGYKRSLPIPESNVESAPSSGRKQQAAQQTLDRSDARRSAHGSAEEASGEPSSTAHAGTAENARVPDSPAKDVQPAELDFDGFVALYAEEYATELAESLLVDENAVATAEGADLSVSFVLAPRAPELQPSLLSPAHVREDAAEGAEQASRGLADSAALEGGSAMSSAGRRSGSPVAAHGRYQHGQRVLHFGGTQAVHGKVLAALAGRLRAGKGAFARLSEAEVLSILEKGTIERHGRYGTVYRQGNVASQLYLLVDGCLALQQMDGTVAQLPPPRYAEPTDGAWPTHPGLSAGNDGAFGPTLFGLVSGGATSRSVGRCVRAHA